MLKAEQLHFSYHHQKPLLKALSLDTKKGEVLALIGPNGCGKTTLLKNLSGLLKPQQGQIYLDGQSIAKMKPKHLAQSLAALEQHIPIGSSFTVQQIVELGRLPYLHRWQDLRSSDRQSVESAMARTGISKMSTRTIETLSSGERQRVWLAMALAQEPKVLLLDEPISHLDLNYQIEILQQLQKLAQTGLTVVMSIHELHLVGSFVDRIALMQQGRIIDVGTPEAILTESHIANVFQVSVHIIRDPETDKIISIAPKTLK